MRKAILILSILLAVWLALWLGSLWMRSALTSGDEHAWPLGLGALADVPKRYPRTQISGGAARLIGLARPLGIDLAPRSRSEGMVVRGGPMAFVRGQLDTWVSQELQRTTPEIVPMPSESGEYLTAHAGDLAAVRALLLTNEPIVWPVDIHEPATPLPNLLGQMQLHRVLIASALDRARFGDARAWDDLRAAWNLGRALAGRPDVTSNIVALAIVRRVNAAARKMPVPAPAWFEEELLRFDFRRAFLSAYQAGAWSIADRVAAETSVDDERPLVRKSVDALMSPYTKMSAADMAESWRESAVEIAAAKNCDFDGRAFEARQRETFGWWNFPAREISTPNLSAMWRNVFRFNAEKEATVRALRLRTGQGPMPQSSCSDGSWTYTPDGRSFTFSRKLPDPPVPGTDIPVSFAAGGAAGVTP